MNTGVLLAPEDVNRSTWQGSTTLRWFAEYEGWSDDGERAATEHLRRGVHGQPILDIGVGAGRTTPLLRALSTDYRAIDFAPAMVDLCHTKYPDVDVRHGDARDLSQFSNNSMGLVTFSWNGIDAVGDTDRAVIFGEVLRVLRPGGVFFFSTHNKLGPGHRETPWHFGLRDLKHPKSTARRLASLPLDVRNRRRLRPLNHDAGEWSMMNAGAHHFGIVIHYTTLAHAVAEVEAAGFQPEPEEYASSNGRRLAVDDETSDVWWFHLLAVKAALRCDP